MSAFAVDKQKSLELLGQITATQPVLDKESQLLVYPGHSLELILLGLNCDSSLRDPQNRPTPDEDSDIADY